MNKFKLCLLGEGRVGKTSILLRFCKNQYDDHQISTVQASFLDKHLSVAGESVQLSIWDTAGQERFHALGPLYYRDAHGALLVYDITDGTSFERVKHWVKELRGMLGPEVVLAIAGNKIDLEKSRAVDHAAAEAYAKSVGAIHYLVSAKQGTGLNEVFAELVKKLLASGRGRGSSAASRRRPSSMASRSGGGGGGGGGSGRRGTSRGGRVLIEEDGPVEQKKSGKCCN